MISNSKTAGSKTVGSRTAGLKTAGYTLVEMMLVLVILGIIASLAVPAGGTWYRQAQVRSVGGRMATLLNLARMKSQATGRTMVVSFKTGEKRADILETGYSVTLPGWLMFSEIKGGKEPDPPQTDAVNMLFLPDGSTEPVSITIADKEKKFSVALECPSFGRCKVVNEKDRL